MSKNKGKVALWITICLLALAVVILLFGKDRVQKEVIVELGTTLVASDFLLEEGDAEFIDGQEEIVADVLGSSHVKLRVGIRSYQSMLTVVDTVSPEVVTKDLYLTATDECNPLDFVEVVQDASSVEVTFTEKPNYALYGVQTVHLQVVDEAGNITLTQAELTISKVYPRIVVEAGQSVPGVEEFLVDASFASAATFVTDVWSILNNVVGEHVIEILCDEVVYTSVLAFEDTTPPELLLREGSCLPNTELLPDLFVEEVHDLSEVTLSFEGDVNTQEIGTYEITVVATDAYGNQTKGQTNMVVSLDTEPPVISGVVNADILLGGTISYRKGVTVTDNLDTQVELTIDNSAVNLSEVGIYKVIYTAVDSSGNTAEATSYVHVRKEEYSLDEVNSLADQVLAKIITSEMTPMDSITAIYQWIRSNVSYISHSEKDDWVRGAYEGLVLKKGDCYVFAMTAKILLTRAGITNMDIVKIPNKTSHFWNLVDIGDGWYHYDATPRKDGTVIFYWTDANLWDYSNTHNNSHIYDTTLYPTIN